MKRDPFPKRIVCLTEETTEILYLLGEQARIAGISGFTRRPSVARKEKPVVSAFTSANIGAILELKPDLVIGFSDIQADIARELIAAGVEVWVTNHRSIEGIFDFVIRLGSLVGKGGQAGAWVERVEARIAEIRAITGGQQPLKVYFEEWYDPLFSCIGWVDEIITIAGGVNIFPELAKESLGRNRIIADPLEVVRRNPDVIIASWCGRKVKKEKIIARSGWEAVTAVQKSQVYEMNSTIILQPGPAALTTGLEQMYALLQKLC